MAAPGQAAGTAPLKSLPGRLACRAGQVLARPTGASGDRLGRRPAGGVSRTATQYQRRQARIAVSSRGPADQVPRRPGPRPGQPAWRQSQPSHRSEPISRESVMLKEIGQIRFWARFPGARWSPITTSRRSGGTGTLLAQVPFGHRLGPRVAVCVGVMRTLPDVDLPALRTARIAARRAGPLQSRGRLCPARGGVTCIMGRHSSRVGLSVTFPRRGDYSHACGRPASG